MRTVPVAVLLACGALAGPAAAQDPPPSRDLAYRYDSGVVENRSSAPAVVSSQTIRVEGSPWLRLAFRRVQLSGEPGSATGSLLRITSHEDGAVQEMDATHVRQWRLSSAYFNGDAVQVEVLAWPGTGTNRVVLDRVTAGLPPTGPASQCGPSDDRVLSSDPRAARTYPAGCSSWIFDDCNHCMGTAGHCDGSSLQVAQFNVPLSNSEGSINHPPPEDQYAIDFSSKQSFSGGVGEDWAYFGCFPNSNTGLTPVQAQGAFYTLAAPPPWAPGETIRITGYGSDNTPPTHNRVQQTHVGPYFARSGTRLQYQTDTTGGNSGSPVIWESGGGVVIGVHTHGGCSSTSGNSGTGSDHAGWTNARNNPRGVCDPMGSSANYCSPKVNSLGCVPNIFGIGVPTESGGPGSFSILAGNVLNNKAGLLFYGFLPANVPFQGGTLCVAAPVQRTAARDSGGSPTGSDCTGLYSFDMGGRIASGIDPGLVCGAIVYAQYWSRDPGFPAPNNTGLTEGLRFQIGD